MSRTSQPGWPGATRYAIAMTLVLGSCAPAPGVLTVDVSTDLSPGLDFDTITVELRAGDDPSGRTVREEFLAVGSETAGLEDGLEVARFPGLEPGRYLVTARLSGGDTPFRRDASLDLNADRTVTILISRACRDVVCPSLDAPTRTECVAGVCRVPTCVDLEDVGCEVPGCATDLECDDGDPCTVDSCDPLGNCRNPALDCDDGDPCTADRCDVAGCRNEALDCDDGDPCTEDRCDLTDGCLNEALADGTPTGGGEFALCCAGVETHVDTSANCGGCGTRCPGGRACVVPDLSGFGIETRYPSCGCSDADQVCPTGTGCNTFLAFCSCDSEHFCPTGQACRLERFPDTTNTYNYCAY